MEEGGAVQWRSAVEATSAQCRADSEEEGADGQGPQVSERKWEEGVGLPLLAVRRPTREGVWRWRAGRRPDKEREEFEPKTVSRLESLFYFPENVIMYY